MILRKISLNNIRSYKNEEVVFPEGKVLLAGDIGSGKTSILLAIEYALFGLQPGQRGSSLLANDSEAGGVTLEMDIEGKKIIIERGLKRTSKSVNQEYALITIDGETIESSVTEIKTKILELLNYPVEFIRKNNLLYRYTVYTPQEEMKQIILEDANSRLDVLRHVFEIDKYKRITENLQRLTSKLKEDIRVLQVQVSSLEDKKEKLSSSLKFINILETKLSEKESELVKAVFQRKETEKEVEKVNKLVIEKENFKKEIEKTQIMISSKLETLASTNKDIRETEAKIKISHEEVDESKMSYLIEEIKKTGKKISSLSSYLIEVSSKIDSLRNRKKEELIKKNRIFEIDICPTCLQDVPEAHKHNILNEAESNLVKVDKEEKILSEEKDKISVELEKENANLKRHEEEKNKLEIQKIKLGVINANKKDLSELVKTKDFLEKDISFLGTHLQSLKESTLEFTKFDNLLEIRKDELKKAFGLEKTKEIELAEIRKELEITKREIRVLESDIVAIEKIKLQLIEIIDLETWLSNNFLNLINFTEKNILIALRKEFTKMFNKWFSMLTSDAFEVYLDESFSPIILQGDFELDYAYLSGGERTAVALAYRLALNQLINSILSKIKTHGLIILDEPTDGFSDAQLDKVRDILQELNVRQLIIVSHEQKIEGFVDNIIRLKKENGVSMKEVVQ